MTDTDPPKEKENPRKGLGAQEGSARREFRRFRKPPANESITRTAHPPRPPRNVELESTVNGVPTGDSILLRPQRNPRPRGHRPSPRARRESETVAEPGGEIKGGMVPCAAKKQDEAEPSAVKTKKKKVRVCRYFNTPEGCNMGDNCKFRHPQKVDETISKSILVGARSVQRPIKSVPFIPKRVTLSIDAKGSDQAASERKSEINYYKRRFQHSKLEETSDGSTHIMFEYKVMAKDWPFDARALHFAISIPLDFPLEKALITMSPERNSELPDILCEHVQTDVQRAIDSKFNVMQSSDAFEIIGKWLIKWIDHNIFTMFVAGLRKAKLVLDAHAAGISLVSTQKPENSDKIRVKNSENPFLLVSDMEKTSLEEKEEPIEGESESDTASSSDGEDDAHIGKEEIEEECEEDMDQDLDNSQANKKDDDPTSSKPPIEINITWNDSSRNVASLSLTQMQISSRCSRCKQDADNEVPANDKPVGWRCARCSTAQSLRLRSELVHENSSIIGRLDARGCRPMDCVLLNTKMKFVCLGCNKEDEVQKLSYGEPHKSWCKECHKLVEFVISTVRFRGDFSRVGDEDGDAAARLPKPKKKIEVKVGIIDGQALPDYGTCKHYKKSYRWFRFPCCGKVFPCDNCHNEKETAHEMKLANRMICGYCSKEQPFAKNKPCIQCNENVTRVHSRFWEGGKGCRDQKMMNKNDSRKFSNGRKKTVSKKKVGDLVTKKK